LTFERFPVAQEHIRDYIQGHPDILPVWEVLAELKQSQHRALVQYMNKENVEAVLLKICPGQNSAQLWDGKNHVIVYIFQRSSIQPPAAQVVSRFIKTPESSTDDSSQC
jgi:hypothetical protein